MSEVFSNESDQTPLKPLMGRNKMTDKLLAVIAINLTIITGILVLQTVPNAQAFKQLYSPKRL